MIASLSSDSIGQTVSSGSSSSSAASPECGTGSSTGTTGARLSSSSSSGFAELINDNTMTMTVSLSEDDISSVKVGQIATVSITALSGVELAGHVTSISPLGSDSSGVVSYDATITVTRATPKVLPGDERDGHDRDRSGAGRDRPERRDHRQPAAMRASSW